MKCLPHGLDIMIWMEKDLNPQSCGYIKVISCFLTYATVLRLWIEI